MHMCLVQASWSLLSKPPRWVQAELHTLACPLSCVGTKDGGCSIEMVLMVGNAGAMREQTLKMGGELCKLWHVFRCVRCGRK